MEHLFDDTLRFIADHIQPITPKLRQRLSVVPTKGQRGYDHDIHAFFTPDQIIALYAKNPAWSAVEMKVYGGLYGQPGSLEMKKPLAAVRRVR